MITFSWFDGIIRQGWKNPIKEENLYDIHPESAAVNVMSRWSKFWKQQSDKKKPKGVRMSILPTMVLSFGPLYFYSFLNKLAQTLIQQVNKYILYCTLTGIVFKFLYINIPC